MIVGNPIIMILKAILNWFHLRRDYIANAVDKIPPEIKDAIVAWYSPCKQKLTNYDVIESYAEDFTKFMNYTNRGKAVVIPNKIIITESETNNLNIVENFNKSTNDITIKVTGVSQEVQLFVQDFNSYRQYISKDGIYRFTDNNYQYFGFGINKITTGVNVVIEQLPTSILKDFSGNGNHAYLYGGKGKLNSGMGLYKVDFTTYINKNNILDIKPNSFITNAGASYINSYYSQIANNIPTYNIKVANLNGSIKYSYKDTDYTDLSVIIEKDGTYNLPISYKVNENKPTGFSINSSTKVTITQIPDYPDQLCYDGKMYAVCYGFPILTDYTVMAERTWFDTTSTDKTFISKRNTDNSVAAFLFEKVSGVLQQITSSFGANNNVEFIQGISYQSKNRYNGVAIKSGNATDNDTLVIGGSILNSRFSELWTGCHGDILLFNRTLTDDELDLVKEHFFGIESNIKDALMTTDKKYLALVNNNYIKLNK